MGEGQTVSASVREVKGTATAFPMDSFLTAASHLRRPFTPEAVKFKVQATYPKSEPTGALIVGYIDARLVVERLNLIVPHLWHDEYEPAGQNLMLCRLTVDGITRRDVGEGQGKALYSDALKRAAVKFGVGVSLYAVPQAHLKLADGTVKVIQTAKGPTLAMTPSGDNRIRTIYRMWLDSHGAEAFGDPLSHGDAENAQGDPEADPPTVDDSVASSPQVVAASDQQRTQIYTSADARKIPNRVLANIVLAATDNPSQEWEDEDAASAWLERALKRLPEDKVNAVFQQIVKRGAHA